MNVLVLSLTVKELEAKQSEEDSEEGVVIKSLEEIQRERALQSMKVNRLKKQTADRSSAGPSAQEETEEPSQEPWPITSQKREPIAKREPARDRPIEAKKRPVMTSRRAGKQEIQLYKPPGAKLKGQLRCGFRILGGEGAGFWIQQGS